MRKGELAEELVLEDQAVSSQPGRGRPLIYWPPNPDLSPRTWHSKVAGNMEVDRFSPTSSSELCSRPDLDLGLGGLQALSMKHFIHPPPYYEI